MLSSLVTDMQCKEWTASDRNITDHPFLCTRRMSPQSPKCISYYLFNTESLVLHFDSNKHWWAFLLPSIEAHLTKQRILRTQHSRRDSTLHWREKNSFVVMVQFIIIVWGSWSRMTLMCSPKLQIILEEDLLRFWATHSILKCSLTISFLARMPLCRCHMWHLATTSRFYEWFKSLKHWKLLSFVTSFQLLDLIDVILLSVSQAFQISIYLKRKWREILTGH